MTRYGITLRSILLAGTAVLGSASACARVHSAHSSDPSLREPPTAAADEGSSMAPAPGTGEATAGRAPRPTAEAGVPAPTAGTGSGAGDASVAMIAAASSEITPPPPGKAQPTPPDPMPSLSLSNVPLPSPVVTVESGATLPAGVWAGESRTSLACDSTSARVVLQVSRSSANEGRATIVFGEDPFTAIEVDPELGFPPGADRSACNAWNAFEGFVYDVLAGLVRASGRFSFRVAGAQPYDAWCALQPSHVDHLVSGSGYACGPPEVEQYHNECGSADDRYCPIDKDRYASCAACLCLKDGCRANLNRTLAFDLQIDGSEMAGRISSWSTDDAGIEVRLRRID